MKKYIDRGVFQQKIVQTSKPSVCNWSLTRKCLVGENGIEPLEIIDNEITFKNNRMISLQIRENLSDEKNQETPSVGVEPSFFKPEEKKSEDLGNLPSTSPAPAA